MDGSNLLGEDGSPTLFTAGEEFGTVSRGDPVIQEMDAQAQHAANLTEETWRLEITADSFVGQPHATEAAKLGVERTRGGCNAVDLPALRALAETQGLSVIKAMQCLNVEAPLGQGLWYGGTPERCPAALLRGDRECKTGQLLGLSQQRREPALFFVGLLHRVL